MLLPALCLGRKASIPRHGHALSHAACAMLGSQLQALLQTPWDQAQPDPVLPCFPLKG